MDMQTKVPMATDTNDDSVRVDDLVEDCFFPFYRRPHVDSTTPWILIVASKLIPSPNEACPEAFPHDGLGCVQS